MKNRDRGGGPGRLIARAASRAKEAIMRLARGAASRRARAAVVALVLLLGGLQLFCLGILGEYISKIYVQVKNRPVFILKNHLGADKKKAETGEGADE